MTVTCKVLLLLQVTLGDLRLSDSNQYRGQHHVNSSTASFYNYLMVLIIVDLLSFADLKRRESINRLLSGSLPLWFSFQGKIAILALQILFL